MTFYVRVCPYESLCKQGIKLIEYRYTMKVKLFRANILMIFHQGCTYDKFHAPAKACKCTLNVELELFDLPMKHSSIYKDQDCNLNTVYPWLLFSHRVNEVVAMTLIRRGPKTIQV